MKHTIGLAVILLACSHLVARGQDTRATTGPASQPAPEPTLVTLKLDSPDPFAVFSALAEQGHLTLDDNTRFLLQKEHSRLPDVQLTKVPLWEALCTLTENAPFVFKGVNPKGDLSLSEAPVALIRPPTATSGPFMLAITQVEVNIVKSVDFAGRSPMNVSNRYNNPPCRIALFATAEPRLKPLRWSIDSVECTGGDGKPIPTGRDFNGLGGGEVNSPMETQIRFDTALDGVKVISSMRVTARFMLEHNRQTFEVDKPLEVHETTYTLGSTPVTFSGVRELGTSNYTYTVTGRREGRDPKSWEQFRTLVDRFHPRLVDAEGKTLNSTGGGGRWNSSSHPTSRAASP